MSDGFRGPLGLGLIAAAAGTVAAVFIAATLGAADLGTGTAGRTATAAASQSAPASTSGAATSRPVASPAETPPATGAQRILAADTFDLQATGAVPRSGWRYTNNASAAIVPLPTSVDRSLRISAADGTEAGACRSFPRIAGGTLWVETDLLLDLAGEAGRFEVGTGSGRLAESPSLIATPGRVTYRDGSELRSLPSTFEGGSWFHLSLVVQLDRQRLDLSLTRSDGGVPVFVARGVARPLRASQTLDRVCFAVTARSREASLYLDDVRVQSFGTT